MEALAIIRATYPSHLRGWLKCRCELSLRHYATTSLSIFDNLNVSSDITQWRHLPRQISKPRDVNTLRTGDGDLRFNTVKLGTTASSP